MNAKHTPEVKLSYVYDDGGRAAAGFKGKAGDCVARSIAIVSGRPYAEVYAALAAGTGAQRAGKRGKRSASAREGINTSRKWFKDYMAGLGFRWVPTMLVGQGCKVHLRDDELPAGRLVVAVSKHYTAVVDGEIRDTHDPRRDESTEIGRFESQEQADRFGRGFVRQASGTWHRRIGGRCVYGYWIKEAV